MRANNSQILEAVNSNAGLEATDEVSLVQAPDRNIAGSAPSEAATSQPLAPTSGPQRLLSYKTLTGR